MLGAAPKKVDLDTLDLSKLLPKLRQNIENLFEEELAHRRHSRTDENLISSLPGCSSNPSNSSTAGADLEKQKRRQENRERLLYRRRERALDWSNKDSEP